MFPPLYLMFLLLLPHSLAQCPTKECSCDTEGQDLILYCRSERLSIVPEFADTSYVFYEVTLSDNEITSLQDNAFKTTSGAGLVTEILDMSENPITYISDQAFAGLETSLKVLKLHVSGMTSFPTVAIQRLTGLKELHLKGFVITTLPTGALAGLSQLQVLSMDSCGLSELSETDFTSQINTLEEVDLQSNQFTSVPSSGLSVLTQLSTLNLVGNQITEVLANTFSRMNAIEEVKLEQNGLTLIETNAFQGAGDTIKRLFLGNNKPGLTESDLVAVKALYNLEELDLSYNTLASLPTNLFQNMQRLVRLSVQNNAFRSLDSTLFSGLGQSMREVNCMENQITDIADGTFTGLTGLQTLRLDRNPLEAVYSLNTFQGLEDSLAYLSLMDTNFNHDHWSALWALHSLETLDLEENKIRRVPDNTFQHYTSLKTLDLKNNEIESLSQRSLRGLHTSLKQILLEDNLIQTLSECVFYEFDLDELQLRNNPLHCDCQSLWLQPWAKQQLYNHWKCATPAQHANVNLKDIPTSELCDSSPPVEQCEEFTTSTTTLQPTLQPTQPTLPTYPIHLNVTGIASTSLHLLWQVSSAQDVSGWRVMCSQLGSGEVVYKETFTIGIRQTQISDLTPSTEYFICVIPLGSSLLQQACINEKTGPDPGAVYTPTQKTLIILGAVLGVVLVIAALVIALVCYMRWRNRHAHPKFKEPTMESHSNPELPQVSDQSKRFSKAKSHSLGTLNGDAVNLDRRLDGFTSEERNHILKLFSNTGASTLSMLSTASQRYTHEPGRPGYLNPMQVSQELGRQDSGEYQEIPADTYDEIPLDRQDTYNEPYEDRPRSTGDILGGASNYI